MRSYRSGYADLAARGGRGFRRNRTGRAAAVLVAIAAAAFVSGVYPLPTGLGHAVHRAAVTGLVSGPVLTLAPSPQRGNAPLSLNVSASVSGGTPPYRLSVCFATQDHSTQTPDCSPVVANWPGTASLTFPHVYPNAGNFTVLGIVSDQVGSRVGSTALIVVTSGPPLTAHATESITQGAAPLTVEFTQVLEGGTPPTSIQWDFGDGSLGSSVSGAAVTHTYLVPGRYTPSLTVADGAGHLAVTSLPEIVVSTGNGGSALWNLAVGSPGTWAIVAIVTGAGAIAAAISVRALRIRRWKQEGDRLLEEIERADDGGFARRPPP